MFKVLVEWSSMTMFFSLGDKVSGNVVLEGSHNPINNLYYLFLHVLDRQAHVLNSSYRLWHRCMGHPSKEVIQHLPEHTKGVDPVGDDDSSPCEGCQWGKSHHLPFPASEKCATKPLELVHSDLDGPMHTTSVIGHCKYFMSFLDDASSLGRAYYLKDKSEALQAFEDLKAWAENVTGHRINGLCSDRGGNTLLMPLWLVLSTMVSHTIRQCQALLNRMGEQSTGIEPLLKRIWLCFIMLV